MKSNERVAVVMNEKDVEILVEHGCLQHMGSINNQICTLMCMHMV